ncbi:MAG: phosphoglucosamine mutase, partial [Clostridia bacterium]|nr:phosphoglucosamine mutase [Clostridia bacterium]
MGRLFGTDGARGIANEALTCELALYLGRAAAMVLTDELRPRPRVVLGADTRMSSSMLACAV